jgi:hypothetical protein
MLCTITIYATVENFLTESALVNKRKYGNQMIVMLVWKQTPEILCPHAAQWRYPKPHITEQPASKTAPIYQ